MKLSNFSRLPSGFKDRFFESAEKKKTIEFRIDRVFRNYRYSPVILPAVEFSSVFLQGLGEEQMNKMFQFFDSQGHLLALSADPTCSLARLACGNLATHSLPLRLYYITSVFRKAEPFAGLFNEFTQAGVELIGDPSINADLEILSVVLAVLNSFDSLNYQINLSHSGFLDGLLAEMNLEEESCRTLYELFRSGEKTELEKYLAGIPWRRDKKMFLLELRGKIGGQEMLDQAFSLGLNDISLRALSHMKTVKARLGENNVNLVFDLGLVKKFEYYTGIIFQIFARQSRFPLGGGGRYDELHKKFGRDLAAVGFSLTVDRLEEIPGRVFSPGMAGAQTQPHSSRPIVENSYHQGL